MALQFGLGWVPDVPDIRDIHYSAPLTKAPLPTSVSLRPNRFQPPIWNQGNLGSCTGWGFRRQIEYALRKQGINTFSASPLFLYYIARQKEHTISEDAGAMPRDVIKQAAKLGTCSENMWPYDIAKFADRPPTPCFLEALRHQVMLYRRVPRILSQMKGVIASGLPFGIGISVYESIEEACNNGGKIRMPRSHEQLLGGHWIVVTGYNDNTQMWELANSWGPDVGDAGYFYLPYAYTLEENLADDFWVVQLVENGTA